MQKKIILNFLPPADFNSPSASLSILKSFLNKNNIATDVIYWNFLLDKYMESEKKDSDKIFKTNVSLLPFYYIIAEEQKDKTAVKKIESYYNSLNSKKIIYNKEYKHNHLDEIKNKILKKISATLGKINFDEVLLWGISGKLFQWIPGVILAKEIKKINPNTKIVIGGFGNKDEALELLKTSIHIDFAIYGEGEYPLLELSNEIEKKDSVFENIPRLIYRENGKLLFSKTAQGKYLDFDDSIYPDYSDYFNNIPKEINKSTIQLPVNSIRSCRWNRCKFCNYSKGYKYRERSPESIVKEIEYFSDKYNIKTFNFVDNDVIGYDIKRFEHLCDLLIKSKLKHNKEYHLWAQIILHKDLDTVIYKKMALAGFDFIFAGYEAISENILIKMDKSHRFANNILYLKLCIKYGIKPNANLIKGVPDEAIEDVSESVENLHFLRFYFHGHHFNFEHYQGIFTLYKDARYFKTISDSELQNYHLDTFSYYLPSGFILNPENLFGWMKNLSVNTHEWHNFNQFENFYKTQKFTYNIIKYENEYHYKEYVNENEESSVFFYEPEYIDILKAANDKVISFDELNKNIKTKYPNITKSRIKKVLSDLKKSFLLYHNSDYSNIVTVIDTDLV